MLMSDFDLFAMSETWLNSTWTDPELAIDNYTIYRYDSNYAKGGMPWTALDAYADVDYKLECCVLARTMYKRTRNQVVKLIPNAKSNYFKEKIVENKDNTRNLWKLLKHSAPTKPTSKAPNGISVNGKQVIDPVKIADAFNEYFTSINATTVPPDQENLTTSQSELDVLLQDFVNSHMPPSSQDKFCIPLITKEIVEADLRKIPSNKATGLDGISVRVLKEALPVISPSLALIYNAIISNGVFPAAFKIAKVLPLHKRDSTREGKSPSHICSTYPL
ncbi:putative RNA-directed DNA polymerase from transposon BS [Stylophora pistillata]|uniref:Putative RNA-directed DNA polymerase from transposon BS n=1 Tax=Stylophora pistillata TaxID=50429 RepID=A0A2B4SVI8_STYPI|nr:putative RNA-directed DNA polymerase from transposon BS [Stylophora pistillata]